MTESERRKVKWLSEYTWIQLQIDAMEKDIEKWRTRLEGLGAQLIDGMPRGHSNNADQEEIIMKIEELDHKMTQKLMDLINKKDRIFDAINTVDDPVAQILLGYRYLDGWSWEKICVEMHYSWKHIHRLHLKAIRQVKIEDDIQ